MLRNGLAVEAEVLISHFPLVCFCNLIYIQKVKCLKCRKKNFYYQAHCQHHYKLVSSQSSLMEAYFAAPLGENIIKLM